MSGQAVHGVHEFDEDPRNDDVLVYVNGELRHRAEAVVSVFDSGFVLGDGVWEGLRVHGGRPVFLDRHLDRLFEGARALALDIGMSRDDVRAALQDTLDANGMADGVHVRLMVTRGVKRTPYQDPRMTIGPATVVIVPEYKEPSPAVVDAGIRLFTVHVRRPYPDVVDPKLNSHSKLNDIVACIQAYTAGADEALMLDPHGFVATCNSTHFFIVRRGELWTSSGAYCLGGITRGVVLRAGPGRRHPDLRAGLQPHRRLRGRRGVRHRHVRGARAGPGGRRPPDRRRRGRRTPDDGPPAGAVPGGGRAGRRAGRGRGLTVHRGPTVRLAVWSGPRNLSTALMRSWENRPDTVVVDEPLYAHYLGATGLDHPGRDEVIAAGETDWRRVVAGLAGPVPDGIRVQYQKQMAHHLLPEIDRDWVAGLTNVMLIRDPREVVASYVRARESVAVDDIGLPQQVALYDDLAGAGPAPPVDRRPRLPRPPGALPPGAVRPRRGPVHPADALLASGFPAVGRCVGPPLVRRGLAVDRVRPARARRPAPLRPPRRGGRAVPPALRAAPSGALGAVTAGHRPR